LLDRSAPQPEIAIIAELKQASPSRGPLCTNYDPPAIARGYRQAGASALSVLTDREFFRGALEDLRKAKAASSLPVLRKDFTIDEYHLYEAAAAGADAVLLIVAILEPPELARLHSLSRTLGLDALVEVHTAEELQIALDAGAAMVGVNNRDLKTFEVSLDTSFRLIERIPDEAVAVSESGLRTAADLARLRAAGFDAFLIGERFMTEPDPGAALANLLSEVTAHAPVR
jgi:indole-3-glycerol phosphate synthase